jgi:hypothetical protein
MVSSLGKLNVGAPIPRMENRNLEIKVGAQQFRGTLVVCVQKVVKKGRISAQKLLPNLGWQEMTPTFGDGRRLTFSVT